jgi:hypothetical protein
MEINNNDLNFLYRQTRVKRSSKLNDAIKEFFEEIKPEINMITIPVYINTRSGKQFFLIFNLIIEKSVNFTIYNYYKISKSLKDFGDLYFLDIIYKSQLKTALISILMDSYAHNISAHSLSALKWWFELRSKILGKRFFIDENKGLILSRIQPDSINITRGLLSQTTEKYYSALGLSDSTYNKDFFSVLDYIQFKLDDDPDNLKQLLNFAACSQKYSEDYLESFPYARNKVSCTVVNEEKIPFCFNPQFTIPLDYALFPFFRFLRDKGAFWSGITRDMAFGGESKTWYKILWEDFANNPLYLGTIAKSEGITKLKINLSVNSNNKWVTGRFVTIDLSLMNYEERIANNPSLEIKYQKNDYSFIENYLNDLDIDKKKINDKERDKLSAEVLEKLDKKLHNILSSTVETDEGHCNEDVNKEDSNELDCIKSNDNYIPPKKYNQYAFIRLGECFTHFREILESEEYSLFLPGGIVGEHSLFTIFENCLRNIKHYKNRIELENIKRNGIELYISINKERLKLNWKNNSASTRPDELFKIAVWLGHPTDMIIRDKTNEVSLWEKVTNSTKEPIIDSNGNPKMGGNSQDKACAAMLLNNKFISVDDQEGIYGHYYPWLHYTMSYEKNNRKNDKATEFPPTKMNCETFEIYNKQITDYKEKMPFLKGYFKKHFYVWRSCDYFTINNEDELKGDNISRFKFVIVSKKISNYYKIINEARQEGVIRLIVLDDSLSIEMLAEELETKIPSRFENIQQKVRDERLKYLYSLWFKSWLNDNPSVTLAHNYNQICISYSNSLKFNNCDISIKSSGTLDQNLLPLSHGGGDESKACNVRSHGNFWGKYFSKVVIKQPSELFKNAVSKNQLVEQEYLLFDFLEVVLTNVMIFDNRLWSRLSNDTEKMEVYKNNLKLIVNEELIINTNGGELSSNYFKQHLVNQIKKYGTPNVLVIHLSYIEALGYKESTKGFMNLFIENELDFLINKENFLFIIVTGRGRNSWKEDLKGEYYRNTLFKPIESFIHAIESGISYNDNFDVKHNVIKVIFGS